MNEGTPDQRTPVLPHMGTVVIGRNEGDKLSRCLRSLHACGRIVYVDSASSDGSENVAESMGVEVVRLTSATQLSAARARNAGIARLQELVPDLDFVMFIDGDCEVFPDWVAVGQAELLSQPQVAVVCGRRRERNPERSIYNRLADMEWDAPIGLVKSCGGDSIMRRTAFEEVGGFNASATSGEEPELCQRLRKQGWQVLRIDADMTLHDSGDLNFLRWWRRCVRSGYGALDIALRFRQQGESLYLRDVKSALGWAIGWPIAVALTAAWRSAVIGRGHTDSSSVALSLPMTAATAVYPAQVMRVALNNRVRAGNDKVALQYAALTMLSKWAHVLGQIARVYDGATARMPRLIEYKS